jgi:hypothetical protein
MSNPKFILTRFTHGSAGKFLSTMLQTSDNIDHWSAVVQSCKKTKIYTAVSVEYVKRSFPKEHCRHLRSEPMIPYNSDLYSVGYSRGNEVTIDQYVSNAVIKHDYRLMSCIDQNRLINLAFHKPNIPIFCQGSQAVTITVTTDKEKQWLYQTLWSKHFLETGTEIRHLPSDPEYCSFQSVPTVLEFNNQYRYSLDKKEQLYKNYVLNSHTNSWYFEPEKFKIFDQQHGIQNIFLPLAELLCHDKFKIMIPKLFKKLGLETKQTKLVNDLHKIWLERQIDYKTLVF